MEGTFKVEAKCNYKEGINVEFKGCCLDSAMGCALTLLMAFPEVVVTCEQTGEVMFSQYTALDIFKPQVERGKAIYRAECDIIDFCS